MDTLMANQSGSAAANGLTALTSPALDFVFMRPSRIGVQSAWYGHVPFAQWLVANTAPRVIVELGSHNGVSYAAFCEAAVRAGLPVRCAAIDTWQGDEHAGFYGDDVYQDLKRFHDPRYGGFSTMMRMTFDAARPFFADGSLDLLHIDGLHTYEAVRHDWETWRTALSDRAVVLFHDVNERQGDFGVWRLWDELRAEYPSFTFLHSHGLGVLAVGTSVPEAVLQLCAAEKDAAQCGRLRERFAQLGERWDSHFEQTDALQRRQAAEKRSASLSAELAATQIRITGEYEAELARLHEDLEEARSERDSAWSYQDLLEDEQRRVKAELAQAHADLAQRAEDWERVHRHLAVREAAIEQAQAEAAAARAQAASIETSLTWRVAAPVRRLGHAVPGLSRTARRTSEFARVAMSGQLGSRRALRQQREADIEALRDSRLFDAAFYLSRNPDLAAAKHDPVAHYIWVGAAQGAMPNPYFDGAWYASQHPEIAASGENPLLHWIRGGAAAGFDPNPFLDAAWYVARNPDAQPDPLLHYIETGSKQALDPNPMLDAEAYMLEHAHARQSGLDALRHWWVFGAGMALDPHPLFDVAWYRREHKIPADADPLAHWMQTGRHQGLATSSYGFALDQPAAFATEADPEASVVIPAYGHPFDTIRALWALAANTGEEHRFEVLVADDNPECRIAPLLQRRFAGLRTVENPVNLGFLRTCNNAAKLATGRVLVLLNNDTAVHKGWLAPLMALMARHADIGMIGCKMVNKDGTLQEAGVAIPSNGWGMPYGAGDDPAHPSYNFVRDVDAVVGACIALRRDAWDAMGGFDDAYAPAYYEEFDLAFGLRNQGWRVVYQPASVVTHGGANSYGAEMRDRQSSKNHALFCRKWGSELATHPPADASLLRLRQRPHDGKVVLFIDDTVPEWDRHAGSLSNRQYIELWQSLGYQVVFAPAIEKKPLQPYTGVLQQQGVEVLFGPGTLEAWLDRFGRHVDVIWTARPDVTGPLLPVLRANSDAPILYYPHDVHHVRERKRWETEGDPRALSESERLEKVENRIFGAVDCVMCISGAEEQAIRAGVPTAPILPVPAYIYPPPPPAPDAEAFAARDVLLFVGGYPHLPNVDAARFLHQEIMPLVWQEEPAVTLVLAGSSPPLEVRRMAGPRVEVPGFVPDLAPLTARARISVSPLRYGAGVKGKVVAALWDGLPVVSTQEGVDGIGLRDGVDCLIADTAEGLAAAIVSLWRDPARCAAMAHAGTEVISRSFTAAVAARALKDAVALAAERRRTRKTKPHRAARTGAHA